MKVRHLRQIFHIGVNRAEIQRFQLFFFILFVHLIYWACQRSLIFLTASARKKTFDTLTILIGFMVELKIVPVVAIACFVPSLWSRIGTLYKHRSNIHFPICYIYYCFVDIFLSKSQKVYETLFVSDCTVQYLRSTHYKLIIK